MLDDEKELLEKNLELTRENNKLLKKMHRSIQWGRFFRIIYWVVIIAAGFGAYYFVQPYISFLQESLGSLGGGVESLSDRLKGVGTFFNSPE